MYPIKRLSKDHWSSAKFFFVLCAYKHIDVGIKEFKVNVENLNIFE